MTGIAAGIGRQSWLWASLAALAMLFVLIAISRVVNRPLPASRAQRTDLTAMRRAAVSEIVRVHRALHSPATTDSVREARRTSLRWTTHVEQTLHDIAYGIGVMRTAHIIFGHDREIRAELERRHIPFDDCLMELEGAAATIVAAINKYHK